MKKLLLGMLFSLLLASSAFADSWLPPSVRSYSSANGEWKLTVYPRGLTNQLNYFQDKVDGKPNAGGIPGDTQASPVGHMERKQGGRWQTAWKAPLVNDVSPVEALVSNDGTTVTFDNWHSVGWGDDAVVIYAVDGSQVRKFGLSAFLPKHYINAVPRSVSSIHWRGEPRIDESARQLVIPVVVPSADGGAADTDKERFVDVRFGLADGALVPLAGKAWSDANEAAVKENARLERFQAEARRQFISPLAAPHESDTVAWYDYLRDAFFRIDPDWEEGYPATQVVPLRDDPKSALLTGHLGDELSDDMNADGVIMIASPSQDVLVQALQQQAKRAKPGTLAKARVYVAADNTHMPAVQAALAHTGGKVIQLDIDATIPQRKERLERYLKDREQE
jgi:hypothetical protein